MTRRGSIPRRRESRALSPAQSSAAVSSCTDQTVCHKALLPETLAQPPRTRSLAYGHPTGGQGQAADSRHRSGWAHPGPDPAATSAQSPQKTRPPLLGPQHQKAVSSCVNSTEEVGLCLVLDACTLSVCMHGAPTADPGLHKSPQTLTQPCALPVSGHVVPALPWDSASKNTSPGAGPMGSAQPWTVNLWNREPKQAPLLQKEA